MTKKNRLIAVLLAVTVVFVVLFSTFFIAENADHDCDGSDCLICNAISICENALKSIVLAAVAVILAAFLSTFTLSKPSLSKRLANNASLVTLKVKLSN